MDENNAPTNTQSQPTEIPHTSEIQSTPQTDTQPNPKNPKNTSSDKGGLIKKTVIVLILLLAFAAAVIFGQGYYKTWQLKQRDSQRKADIQALQKALEVFRNKTKDQKYYPGNVTEFTMVKTGVMQKLPKDPKNEPPYTYLYTGKPAGCTATCTGYILFACLENTSDPEGKAPTMGTCKTKIYEVTK